jgi:hypothetical protein
MDKKKRTILLICAAIFLGSYLARSFVISALRMAYAQQQGNRQRQKPKPDSAATQSPAVEPSPAEPPLPNLSGVWESHGQVPGGRGMCDLRLELKQNDPSHYSAFSRFSCLNNEAIVHPKDANVLNNILTHTNPDAAILTGAVEKGSIHFHADKTIGTDINGCAVTEFTVTPFGASAVAAEWLEGTCQGGSLLMQRR